MSQPNNPGSATLQAINERERIAELHPTSWANPDAPERYPLVVVGAGFAGLAAARTAAERGIKVALIERSLLGGTCINTGCVPSKAIIRTSRLYAEMRDAVRYGAQVPPTIATDLRRRWSACGAFGTASANATRCDGWRQRVLTSSSAMPASLAHKR